jgi:uncharacterized protein (TIRG00374 family)
MTPTLAENAHEGASVEWKRGRLMFGGTIFLLLTLAIFWYQFHQIHAGDKIPRLNQLQWGYLILILGFLPLESIILGFRMWIVCRVLQPGIGIWTCIKADLVNSGIALLTPSQSGGGIGQIYFLMRGGARLNTAVTITLLTFVGTILALLVFGLYSIFVSGLAHTGNLFTGAVTTLALITAFMLFFGFCPGFFRMGVAAVSRLIWRIRQRRYPLHDWWPPGHSRACLPVDRMDPFCMKLSDFFYTYQADLRKFLEQGKLCFGVVLLLSLTFLASRFLLAYFCVRFLGIQGSTLMEIFKLQTALAFLTYLAPTPGNAGIIEEASLWIMGRIVPLGFAPFYNLLWRFVTVYAAASAGLLFLVQGILADAQGSVIRWRRP